MIANAIDTLKYSAKRATSTLTEARTQIEDSFSKDYVVGVHAMEKLISAQHSVHYWTQITRIIERAEDEAGSVQGLREWVARTSDRLLECGRSSSTSMISNAITLSEEDEQKRVLQLVRQILLFIDSQS